VNLIVEWVPFVDKIGSRLLRFRQLC